MIRTWVTLMHGYTVHCQHVQEAKGAGYSDDTSQWSCGIPDAMHCVRVHQCHSMKRGSLKRLYHLEHQPRYDFCFLPGILGKERASWVLLRQVQHDSARFKHRKIVLIMVNCRQIALSEVTTPGNRALHHVAIVWSAWCRKGYGHVIATDAGN